LIFTDGATEWPDLPIEIIEQSRTTVKFIVRNTFSEKIGQLFTQYHEAPTGETECMEDDNIVSHNTTVVYVAHCMHNVPITIVDIWVSDEFLEDGLDGAEIPECCHPNKDIQNPTAQYTFKLQCVSECVPEAGEVPPARRLQKEVEGLSASDFASLTMHLSEASTSQHAQDTPTASSTKPAPASEPSVDGKDGHFCVAEDYPCGDIDGSVYVCHYSARDGYQTFCVPEADSDVLGFYPKDYCGRCVGGYAAHTTY
jgi:hypothetical protein